MPRKNTRRRQAKKNKANFENIVRSKIKYNYSPKTQTYGAGYRNINITKNFDVDLSTYQDGFAYFNLSDLLLTNEYTSTALNYSYYKLNTVGVTVYPNDTMNNIPMYIAVQWEVLTLNAAKIKVNDNAKIIFNDAKNIKTYFFRPPSVQVLKESYYVNPAEWFSTEHPVIPGVVVVQQDITDDLLGDNIARLRVDFNFSFRGNKLDDANNAKLEFVGDKNEVEKSCVLKKMNMTKDEEQKLAEYLKELRK